MGCRQSKNAVATADVITKSKSKNQGDNNPPVEKPTTTTGGDGIEETKIPRDENGEIRAMEPQPETNGETQIPGNADTDSRDAKIPGNEDLKVEESQAQPGIGIGKIPGDEIVEIREEEAQPDQGKEMTDDKEETGKGNEGHGNGETEEKAKEPVTTAKKVGEESVSPAITEHDASEGVDESKEAVPSNDDTKPSPVTAAEGETSADKKDVRISSNVQK